jgi:hypothetical protein
MKNFLAIVTITILSSLTLNGQTKNYQLGASLNGSTAFLVGAASVDFDFLMPSEKMAHIISLGVGSAYLVTETGNLISFGYKGIVGKKNNHFDFQLCLGLITAGTINDGWNGNSNISGSYPLIGIGYRYQKPSGKFMFRTGISTTGLSMGVGYFFPLTRNQEN